MSVRGKNNKSRAGAQGTIYLLHLDAPIGAPDPDRESRGRSPRKQEYFPRARHYMGWTDNLPARLDDHAAGRGARFLAAALAAGVGWSLVRTWEGTRGHERKLKRRKNAPRLCPVCQILWTPIMPGDITLLRGADAR